MSHDPVDELVRRAIGDDAGAVAQIATCADTSTNPMVLVMSGLLQRDPAHLDRALVVATTSRDRQVVAIARAHLDGRIDHVDAMARDHLVDHPDSVLVAWIASGAGGAPSRSGGC